MTYVMHKVKLHEINLFLTQMWFSRNLSDSRVGEAHMTQGRALSSAFAIAFMHDFLGSSFLASAPSFQMCSFAA